MSSGVAMSGVDINPAYTRRNQHGGRPCLRAAADTIMPMTNRYTARARKNGAAFGAIGKADAITCQQAGGGEEKRESDWRRKTLQSGRRQSTH